jgi:hypothetical protein
MCGVTTPEARGTTLRVYLVDGTPQGLRWVDRAGWTGLCFAFSRADYPQARTRPELQQAGAYILVGPDPEDSSPQRLSYIGEGDDVSVRLDSHHREKGFWTHACVLTTKDDSLHKAHVLHSEFEWEWVASAMVMADHGSGLMDLPPQRAGDRSGDAHRTQQRGRGQQSTDRRGRQRQDTRVQQTASPSRGGVPFPRLARVTARNA